MALKPTNDLIRELYEKLHDKLLRVAYRMVGNIESAEDLVQQTFLFALFREEELARHPKPEGWLMRVLQNLALNERKQMARHTPLPLEAALYRAGELPEEPLEASLPRDLPAQDREILLWRFEQNLDYPEIADRLGISETGCRSRVSRAVKRCRALWGE